tara:strand:- start:51 stop:362 length:312 start_codon:yes stop_codon:yes gene_type:complete
MEFLNKLLFILSLIIGLPFAIPFSGFIWAGIVIFNWNIYPWWLLIFLVFWSFVSFRAVPETTKEINKQISQTGYTPTVYIQIIILKLLQYPMFLSAYHVLGKL